jgi:hypothetical protein
MKKIENWNELERTEEVSNFSELEPTQYIVKILETTDEPNKEKLVIKYDICGMKHLKEIMTACPEVDKSIIQTKLQEQDKKDMYGFFYKQMEQFGDWPWRGKLHKSYKETAQRFFTAFITAVEKSNKGFKFAPAFDETKLAGKFFVANFGLEEYQADDGEIKESIKCREERSLVAFSQGKVKDLKIKKLKVATTSNNQSIDTGNFTDIEDDLPF